MKQIISRAIVGIAFLAIQLNAGSQSMSRYPFNDGWKFNLGNTENAYQVTFNDGGWRTLDVPHDWSIELPFDKDSPTGTGGGALRGGLGWYRKEFTLPATLADDVVTITFDGIYQNSEVWINGNYLGKRPNGYISFQYDLTPYINFGEKKNVIAVKVDNSAQPNSRWYSGSGIYRNVWLAVTQKVHVAYNGTHITTPLITKDSARAKLEVNLENNNNSSKAIQVRTEVFNPSGVQVALKISEVKMAAGEKLVVSQDISIIRPRLWSIENPQLYSAHTILLDEGRTIERYQTSFGLRTFRFDVDNGFFLNDKHVKIRGVCNHHDLGALGTAINKRALQRQLEILKDMGCNAIRTSHNPPAPELLDLCDRLGFLVMDEAFDMWKKPKTKYDYHLSWDEWHKRDLEDQLIRDRNHPSVIMWSVGNEIPEQWSKAEDSAQVAAMIRELTGIVKKLDPTRPTVTANNEINKWNRILQADATDIIGYNYNHNKWDSVFAVWGRKPFIVTESVSALQTRGHYDMPSDSIRRWPKRWDLPLTEGNADTTCSAYDNCSTPWGTTHEETMKVFEKYDHISGMFIWTGFDYIGEPTPYNWPARSSYFGIVDLAGFPKDAYYMYQSVWTNKPVLHLFPHWNWKAGQMVDVWAYYNNADEVELFLNGVSLGKRMKAGDDLHVMWRVQYKPGTLKAVSRKAGKTVLTREIHTAGAPAKLILEAERNAINKNNDLAFIKVKVVDKNGNLVPDADNLVKFTVTGGTIVAVDNGNQTSMESFQGNQRKVFKGLGLVVVKGGKSSTSIQIEASSEGLIAGKISVLVK